MKFLLKKTLLAVCFLVAFLGAATAQRQLVGTVTGGDGNGLVGVSVLEKGTTNGTVTDVDGKFALRSTGQKPVLVISYIGFKTQEIDPGASNVVTVELLDDAALLSETVVTALGIRKDRDRLGYAVSEVKGTDLVKSREPNPINSLAGKVAGLTVGASPELLGAPALSLRGATNLLYVVDGVPVNSDTWIISPDDIESYTVLKGPTASALYGSRGQNGAIIITTKKGSADKRGFSVEINSSTMVENGFNAIPKVQDLYGPGDHGRYSFLDGRGGGLYDGDYDVWGPKLDGRLLPQYDSKLLYGKDSTPWVPRGADNLTRFLRPGILSTNNVAVASSTEKYDFRISGTNTYQQGMVPNTWLDISNFATNLGFNFSEKVRFDGSLNFSKQFTDNVPDVQYGPNSLIYNMIIWGGADWDVDDMKNYWQPGKEGIQQIYAEYQRYNNPHFTAQEWLRGHWKDDIIGQIGLTVKPTEWLEVLLRTQTNTYDLLRNEKFPYSATVYGREEAKGDYREDRRRSFESNTDLIAKINKRFAEDFDFGLLLGGNARILDYNSSYATTDYLNVPGVYNFSNSLNPVKIYNYQADMRANSGFYSLDFSWKNAFNLNTTGRVDQLSTLPKGSNTFFYPSVGASFLVSELVDLGPLSFLKLRGSYANVKEGLTTATIGPAYLNSGPLGYGAAYSTPYNGPSYSNGDFYNISLPYANQPAAFFNSTLANPTLQPSSSTMTEVGAELRFLKNRISLDVAYYINERGPAIFTAPISEASGATGVLRNGIVTELKGWDATVTAGILKNPTGLNWDLTGTWGTFKETYKSFGDGIEQLNIFTQIGDRTDEYYDAAVLRTTDGQIINDGGGRPINNPVRQFLGHQNPDWVWGLNNRFGYKNVSFSFQFDGRVGGVIANYIQRQTYRGGRHIGTTEGELGAARDQDALGVKSYLGPGVQLTTDSPAPTFDEYGAITNYNDLKFQPNATKQFAQDYISRWFATAEANLMSRTFSKLREVTITYQMPKTWFKKGRIQGATISLVGRNLLYFAEKKDIDLDQYVTGFGYSGLQTPTTKRYGINFNLTF